MVLDGESTWSHDQILDASQTSIVVGTQLHKVCLVGYARRSVVGMAKMLAQLLHDLFSIEGPPLHELRQTSSDRSTWIHGIRDITKDVERRR